MDTTTRSVCKILQALFGLKLTPGGLTQALDRVADKLQPGFDQLVADWRGRSGVWVDQPSGWVGGPGWRLWTFTTLDLTVYHMDTSRGRQVVLDTLGLDLQGVLTSDCLAGYENLPYKMHNCHAPHPKAIATAYLEQPSDYLVELPALPHATICLQEHRGGLSPPEWTQKPQALEGRAEELLGRITPRSRQGGRAHSQVTLPAVYLPGRPVLGGRRQMGRASPAPRGHRPQIVLRQQDPGR